MTARNFWGLGLIGREAGDSAFRYITDAHGDVRGIIGGDPLTDSYTYEPYGTSTAPDPDHPFRYCSEYLDAETGFYYLRARYYSPEMSRFVSEDAYWNPSNMIYWDADPATSAPNLLAILQSGNAYGYCVGNPVMYVDGNGQFVNTIVGAVSGAIGGALTAVFQGKDVKNAAIAGAVGGALSGLIVDFVTALTGGVIMVGAGIALAGFSGAVGSVVSSLTEHLLDGGKISDFDLAGAMKSAGISAGFSMIGYGWGELVNNAFELTTVGESVVKRLVNSLRDAGFEAVAISAFLTTVFVEMPKSMADTLASIGG